MPSAGDRDWSPRPGLRWQIQLTGSFVKTVVANVYDLDPYETSADTVANLRGQGRQTMCHLNVGVSDLDLPDAGRLPKRVLGAYAGGNRRWLDIRAWSDVSPVLTDRLLLCVRKGFEAVDADATYGYAYHTGFGLTSTDQLTFDRRLADLAHGVGLKVGIRSTAALADDIQPIADFAVVDNCFTAASCDAFTVYVQAGKAVFDVETLAAADFCPTAAAYGYAATRSATQLDGDAEPC